jgi:aspartyl-tRNA(Asn)/glutamyl-tRNA(Gln) amidotransferase subunit A
MTTAMTAVWERDAWELADEVRAGELSAVDLLDVFLERVERFDPELNAFCFLDVDGARAQAKAIDARVAAGEDPGAWAGVPMGVKELAQVAGFPDTHASVLYRDKVAALDGTEAARLRAAGAVLVGLTTAPEFGSVNWTRSFLHGVTRSPWNPERTPGGSSGGSAAAVAAGMMPICTGSDGGGSIRIPSSYSGLFGFKVSFGRVGSAGPFDNSLTSVPGPMCRSVRDAARYVDAIAGPTVADPTSLPRPPRPYEDTLLSGDATAALRGKRVAWSSTLGYAVCDPEVEKLAHEAASALVGHAGLHLVDVEARIPKPSRAWGILSALDVSSHHGEAAAGRLDDVTPVARAGFESTLRLTPEQLLIALRRRDEMLAAIAEVFDQVDLLLTPTVATTAFVAEGPPPLEIGGQRVGGMGSVPFTAPFNVSGQPAVSIPAGLSSDGLPVGLQVVARRHEEELALACGLVMETTNPWPKFAPLAYT